MSHNIKKYNFGESKARMRLTALLLLFCTGLVLNKSHVRAELPRSVSQGTAAQVDIGEQIFVPLISGGATSPVNDLPSQESAIPLDDLFDIPADNIDGEISDSQGHDDYYLAKQARLRNEPPFDASTVEATANGPLNQVGQWGSVYTWPFVFQGAAHLPDGRIVAWGGNNRYSFSGGNSAYASVWDPETNQLLSRDHNDHPLFCSIPVMLEDGRMITNGGDSNTNKTSIFDYRTNQWTRTNNMSTGRWYPGTVALPSGQVFTMMGRPGGPYPEVWTEGSGWSLRTGANLNNGILNYSGYQSTWLPYVHLMPNGNIFHSGPTTRMNIMNPNGNGSITSAGLNNSWYPKYSTTIMYDVGKILVAGGAANNSSNAPGTNRAMILDVNGSTPTKTNIASMGHGRKFSNGVMLPNGEVLVIGGNSSGEEFSDQGSALAAEIWNPTTQAWREVADMSVPRNYHSVALLMTDGRVWSGGGGLCGCNADHPDHQVYSPPYLFNSNGTLAARPQITAAPDLITYGRTFSVQATSNIQKFSLIKMSGVTHHMNSDLRFLDIPFSGNGAAYSLTVPSNPNVLTPGYWMLFALNSQGVPSVAEVIQVSSTTPPPPGNGGGEILREWWTNIGGVAIADLTSNASYPNNPNGSDLLIQFEAPTDWEDNYGTRIRGYLHPPLTGQYRFWISSDDNGQLRLSSNEDPANASRIATVPGWSSSREWGKFSQQQSALITLQAGQKYYIEALQKEGGGGDNLAVAWQIPGSARAVIDGQYLSPYLLNQPPSITNPGSQSSVDGEAVNLSISANDPDEDLLSYSATGLPNGLTINSSTGRITGSPTTAGTYNVTVSVDDGNSGSGSTSFTWMIFNAPIGSNVALGQVTTQSSTGSGGVPGRAVDNNTSGVYNDNSVTHTSNEANAWWQVDLGREHDINQIRLWNRTDCCATRLANFYVFVSATDLTGRTYNNIINDSTVWRHQEVGQAPPSLVIPTDVRGRYVRVQLAGTNFLSLAEVQVYGTAVNRAPTISNPGDQSHFVGESVNQSINASDLDGDSLTYGAAGLPNGLSINSASGQIAGSPNTAGTYNVTVTVNDGNGASDSSSFVWTVQSVPTLIINTITSPPEAQNTTISYTASFSGGLNPRFKWLFGDGTAETAYATSPSTSHAFAQPGRYIVTLTAIDGSGQEVTQQFAQLIHRPLTAQQPVISMSMEYEQRAGNDRLWNVNPDNNTVSVINTVTRQKVAEIDVGNAPHGLAIAPDGRVWITNKDDATISIVDNNSFSVAQTVSLPYASRPHGIAFAPNGNHVFVALEATGILLKLNPATGAQIDSVSVGPNPRHLSILANSSQVYVSRFITPPVPGEGTANPQVSSGGGEVVIVNAGSMSIDETILLQFSNRPDAEAAGRGIPNYLGPAIISPDGTTAWVPSKQDNIARGTLRDGEPLNHDHTVRSISSYIDLSNNQENLGNRVDHDNGGIASSGQFGRYGAFLFVALEGSREIAVVDAYARTELFRIDGGRAPQGVVVSPDGLTLYVHNFMDRSIGIYDLSELIAEGLNSASEVDTIDVVASERLSSQVLNGKQLFYDAKDERLALDAYISCAACHNDGGQDGRVWDMSSLGEGLRNNIELNGRAGMGQGPLHWSANFDEIQDFEGQIRNLAGGTGLMSDADFNATSDPLGASKAGLSSDLDALAAYVSSLTTVGASPYRTSTGDLTTVGEAGRTIFVEQNCAQCHSGAGFTDSPSEVLHDIGTLKPSSGQRLGQPLSGIDTPTLRGLWLTGPYLHDGSALTIEDAVQAHQGVTLSSSELTQLAAYLNQIDDAETTAPANSPPVLATLADQTNIVGDNVNLMLQASDSDNDDLTFTASDLPPSIAISSDGLLSGVLSTEGSYTVTINVDDGNGGTDSATFVWTVDPAPTVLGDANCSEAVDAVDALFVLQYTIGMRTDIGGCPLQDSTLELHAAAGDVDADGDTDAVDALFILQCTVDINNVFCPGTIRSDVDQTQTASSEISQVTISSVVADNTIVVTATGAKRLAAGTIEVAYDHSDFAFESCVTEATSTLACSEKRLGVVMLSFIHPDGLDGDQTVAELTFSPSTNSATNAQSLLTVDELSVINLADERGKAIKSAVTGKRESERIFLPMVNRRNFKLRITQNLQIPAKWACMIYSGLLHTPETEALPLMQALATGCLKR